MSTAIESAIHHCPLARGEIAALTAMDIAQLNYHEMVDVVIASGMAVRDIERIHTLEADVLVRLVYLAREHCRRDPT